MTYASGSVAVILPAAGKSRRFAAVDQPSGTPPAVTAKKIFASLAGRMVWEHAAAALRRRREVGPIVIAVDADDLGFWQTACQETLQQLGIELVIGGSERVASVEAALRTLDNSPFVAIHDAARPLISDRDLTHVFAAAEASGAAILATRLKGTVKRQVYANNDPSFSIHHTVDRSDLWEALTPQVFRTDILRTAFERWRGFPVTDDAQLVERAGFPVRLVEGSPTNIKITVADDLPIAHALMMAAQHNTPF